MSNVAWAAEIATMNAAVGYVPENGEYPRMVDWMGWQRTLFNQSRNPVNPEALWRGYA